MSTGTLQPATYAMTASLTRFSVARYQKMIETGILDETDTVELLEGYVVPKMPRNPEHDGSIDLILGTVPRQVPSGWILRIQEAIVLLDSQPEPDGAIVRGDPRTFLRRHPVAAEVGVAIEVANTSLARDQIDKGRIYARAGIPIYWIINLNDLCIEVYTQPSGPTEAPTYRACQVYRSGETVPLVLDGVERAMFAVADLLP